MQFCFSCNWQISCKENVNDEWKIFLPHIKYGRKIMIQFAAISGQRRKHWKWWVWWRNRWMRYRGDMRMLCTCRRYRVSSPTGKVTTSWLLSGQFEWKASYECWVLETWDSYFSWIRSFLVSLLRNITGSKSQQKLKAAKTHDYKLIYVLPVEL